MSLSSLLPPHLYTPRLRLDLLDYSSQEHFVCLMECMNNPTAVAMMGDCGIRTADDLDEMLLGTRLRRSIIPDLNVGSSEVAIVNGRGDDVVDCDCYYLIRLRSGDDGGGYLIGGVSLSQRDGGDNPPDIGWSVLEAYHGRGYATEAARELLRFVMQDLRIKYVIALPGQSNLASIAVAKKIGMVDSGLLKHQADGETQIVYVLPEVFDKTTLTTSF